MYKRQAQTTALARAMCEKLLARNLTAQDDARLLADLLEKAGAGNGNLSLIHIWPDLPAPP